MGKNRKGPGSAAILRVRQGRGVVPTLDLRQDQRVVEVHGGHAACRIPASLSGSQTGLQPCTELRCWTGN